jgi:DNA-binding NtrC family response regulator
MATMLIIDDDNYVRETLNDLFSATHECHTADRAEQAIAFLELETYDVVLTDISMPGMSGLEVLKLVTEKHPATPVIVISASLDVDEDELIKLGAFGFLPKPFVLEDIENVVSRALGSSNASC